MAGKQSSIAPVAWQSPHQLPPETSLASPSCDLMIARSAKGREANGRRQIRCTAAETQQRDSVWKTCDQHDACCDEKTRGERDACRCALDARQHLTCALALQRHSVGGASASGASRAVPLRRAPHLENSCPTCRQSDRRIQLQLPLLSTNHPSFYLL